MQNTFGVIHTAGSLYDGEAVPYFRAGTPPPPGGTVHLSGYHCYRCLMWVDGEAVAAALEGRRVTRVLFSCESAGDPLESDDLCRVRLYRTDLTYDPDLPGMNSAGTTRFDEGMTAEEPRNAHMKEYFETAELERGGSLQQCEIARGSAARRLAEALKSGYALGVWDLKPGECFFSNEKSWKVRIMRSMTLTLEHEAETGSVPPPDSAEPLMPARTAGGEIEVEVTGIGSAREEDPVTGVYLSWRDESAEGPGPWSADTFFPLEEESERVTLPALAPDTPGETRRFRAAVRTVSASSVYTRGEGTVLALAPPRQCRAEVSVLGGRAEMRVTVPEDPLGGSRVLTVNGEGVMTLDGTARRVKLLRPAAEGENTWVLTLRDQYGGESEETRVSAAGHDPESGRLTLRVNGHDCSAFGAVLTGLPSRSLPKRKEGTERDGEDLFERVSLSFELYAPGRGTLDMLVPLLLSAETLEFGDRPGLRYEACEVTQAHICTPSGSRGAVMEVKAECAPCLYKTREPRLRLTPRGGTVINAGDVSCRPVFTLEGEGDLKLKTGNAELTVYHVSGAAILHCEGPRALDAQGNELTVSGEFPWLKKGENRVELSGNITSASVLARERRL